MRQVVQKSRACTWLIEGDISGCFDNINHDKLLEMLGRQIKDNRLLDSGEKFSEPF